MHLLRRKAFYLEGTEHGEPKLEVTEQWIALPCRHKEVAQVLEDDHRKWITCPVCGGIWELKA